MMLEGLVFLFFAWFLPLIASVIFLLFRFSSRFGYSFITLRFPILAIAMMFVYTLLILFVSGLFGGVALYWTSGLMTLATIVLWVIDSRHLYKLTKQRKTIVKNLNSNRQVVKIIARVLLVIVLVPALFLTLLVLWTFVPQPIFYKLDHDKFFSLDTQIQGVYHSLKTVANENDEWKYRTGCYDTNQNWLSSPDYICEAVISVQKTVISVDELNSLQAKYYQFFNTNNRLKPMSAGLKSAFGFGDNFSVSLAYADFLEEKTNIECTYEINLHQIEKNINYQTVNDAPGSAIIGGQGELRISLRCNESAKDSWYQFIQVSSRLILE